MTRNIRLIRPNQLQNNVCDAVDDGHGGAVDIDAGMVIHAVMTNWMTIMLIVMMTIETMMC